VSKSSSKKRANRPSLTEVYMLAVMVMAAIRIEDDGDYTSF
jgi:hypothetical protein